MRTVPSRPTCQHQGVLKMGTERGGELLEDAAERGRLSMRQRAERLKLAARPIIQMAVASTAAWLFAVEVFGHPRPIFAPISAVVVLGLSVGRRLQRAVELALGVAVGLAIADLVVRVVGVGAWQIALIVLLSTSIAVLLGSGQLFASQVAISGILVATLPPGSAPSFGRFFDSLAGGIIAIAVSALVLPPKPLVMLRRSVGPLLDELAATLADVAAALEARDRAAAEAALVRARGIEELEARFEEAVREGRETARFAPPRRHQRDQVATYAIAAAQVDLAVRNVRVLARGAVRALMLDENVPPELGEALRDLAGAVRALEDALADETQIQAVREAALRAAAGATRVLEDTGNLSVSVLVGQVRSTAVDLLRGTGLSYEEASLAVRRAAQEAQEADVADQA
jgi:uncharacterized membrane protein YgaE (UPF0421/DUF939 family)